MAYWIVTVTRTPGRAIVSLPQAWVKRILDPKNRYIFIDEEDNGTLRIMTEEAWVNERASKLIANRHN